MNLKSFDKFQFSGSVSKSNHGIPECWSQDCMVRSFGHDKKMYKSVQIQIQKLHIGGSI